MDQIRQCMDNKEPSRIRHCLPCGSARVSVRQCMAHYGSDSCPHHRKICSFLFHYCTPNVTHHSFRQGFNLLRKTHVCNWASKIRRCMVNNQWVRLASQTRRCMGALMGKVSRVHRADNNGGYEPLTDEEVIASFLPGANESDAEEADGDIEDPGVAVMEMQ
ncbi:hypothetical protein J6590_044983 [Homalodisca vitripennis]|nr:hypothetical protein J6590_044983 [Homalodisca vitripennis]